MIIFVIALLLGLLTWWLLGRKSEAIPPKILKDKRTSTRHSSDNHSRNSTKPPITYNDYQLSLAEIIRLALLGFIALWLIGYIFYKSEGVAILFGLLGAGYPWIIGKKQIIHKRKKELHIQFKHALYALSTLLSAGKSVETAFQEVVQDLKMIFPEKKAYIVTEIETMNKKIDLGEPVEQALIDFSTRADIEDITNFAQVFVICKRTGGDLIDVIRKTTQRMAEKIDLQQEISVMIAQKKFESNMLAIIPILIVGFLSFSSPEYMAILYHSPAGIIVLTFSLLVLLACFWFIRRIMDIKV